MMPLHLENEKQIKIHCDGEEDDPQRGKEIVRLQQPNTMESNNSRIIT